MRVENLVKDLISNYVNILAYPEKVYLSVAETPGVVVADLESVEKEEIAKLVGKEGALANSIRFILNRMLSSIGKRAVVNFNRVDDESLINDVSAPVDKVNPNLVKFNEDPKKAIEQFVNSYIELAKNLYKAKYGIVKDPEISIKTFETNKKIILEIAGDKKIMGFILGRKKVFLKLLMKIFKAVSGRLKRELGQEKSILISI